MAKPKILIQLDPDKHASTFDAVVAIDSGVEQLFTRSSVSPGDVESLVHGAMFTRGPDDLKYTALFFGGSDVGQNAGASGASEEVLFRTNAGVFAF